MRRSGDFEDTFGGDLNVAPSDSDVETFLKAFEALARRAERMNKSQKYDLQKRIGSAVRDFNLELLRAIELQKEE